MSRSPAAARLAALAVLAVFVACAEAPPAPPPATSVKDLPDVICQPCGDMQPTAYVCSGPVMIRSDVPASRVPALKRYCAEKKRRKAQ